MDHRSRLERVVVSGLIVLFVSASYGRAEGYNITLRQDGYRDGSFVSFDCVIREEVPDRKARELVEEKLAGLKEEWKDKVDRILVEAFRPRNYLPYVKGEWIRKKGITVEVDRDGKDQTEQQTRVLSSEVVRQKIYSELMQREAAARNEADAMYSRGDGSSRRWKISDIDKKLNKESGLKRKYEKELLKKYGLTEKQLSRVRIEGAMKDWPAS